MSEDADNPYLNKAYWNIVLWNLTPYLGVLFLHWDPLSVFVCYALETLVIGAFNVFKLIVVYYGGEAEPDGDGPNAMGVMAIPVFISLYGLLAYMQLAMFLAMCGFTRSDSQENTLLYSLHLVFDNQTLYLALSLFVVSNAYSLVNQFMLTQNYTQVTMNQQFVEPFPRVFISQFVVFAGATIYMSLGNPWIILIMMTMLKITTECYLVNHKLADILGSE